MSSEFVCKRAGFSLLELAIVFAIIGIVLAALWGVVGMVRENIKREEAVAQMTAIVGKIRDYYAGRACASTNFGCPVIDTDLTNYLFRQSVLLPEQLRDRVAVLLVADHPWGSVGANGVLLAGGGLIVRSVGDGRDSFQVELLGLKGSSCVALASALSSAGAPKGLTGMTINGGAGLGLPVTPEAAAVECVAATNRINSVYSLRL